MARAVRKCRVCKRLFPSTQKRKTCSAECHASLASTNGKELRTRMDSAPDGTMVKQANPTHTHWEPSQEYIREQCALIRAGLLVIKDDRVERIEP